MTKFNSKLSIVAKELKIARRHRADGPFNYAASRDEAEIDDVIVDRLAEAMLDL